MYAGRIAEIGAVHEVINHRPPYSAGLMAAIPDMSSERERLHQIDGAMPRLERHSHGLRSSTRAAPQVHGCCTRERPELLAAGHPRCLLAACAREAVPPLAPLPAHHRQRIMNVTATTTFCAPAAAPSAPGP